MDKAKEKSISNEISSYKKIFKDIADDRKPFAERLYNRAAFMAATLDELQNKINKEGAVITATNGNGFETTLEHPAQKSYNTMIKNYNSTIKLLIDLLPTGNKEGDDFMNYVSRGNG